MTKLLTTFLLLSFVGFGQTPSGHQSGTSGIMTSTEWKTLKEVDYTIQYPSTWELNQSGQMGTSFVLFSPLEAEQDKFRENVTLIVQDLAGENIDLNQYTKISEGQIKTMLTNSNLIESKRIKNDAREYHKLIYTGDQGVFHLKYEQFYWFIDDKAYVITFTTEQSRFENYKEFGEKMLNSFKLKK